MKVLLWFLLFSFYTHGSTSISINRAFHEISNSYRSNDASTVVYFKFYPASCNSNTLFSTSASVDFSQSDVVSIGKGTSSSQMKVSCYNGSIRPEVCSGNSSCSSVDYDACSSVDVSSFTIYDVAEIFDVQLTEIVSQLQQNGYQFSDLLNAFHEDWETIVDHFDITIKQLLSDYGVSLNKFVTMTGATLQQLLDKFGIGFDEFVKETDSTLNNILSTFNYDLSSLVTDFHIALSDIESLFNIPFKDVVKEFDLDLQSVEKMFGLTVSQVIKQLNMDISKFLSVFDMSIQEFVQQTGASIKAYLKLVQHHL